MDGALATLGSIEKKVQGLELEQSKLAMAYILEDAGRISESQSALNSFVTAHPKSALIEQAQDALLRLGNTE